MVLELEHPTSAAEWDERLLQAPGQPSMFQSAEFAQVKRAGRWSPRHLVVDGVPVTAHRKLAPGLGAIWYLPKGPGVADVEQLATMLPRLADAARRDGAFLLKIEPELLETPETVAALEGLGLIPAGRIQTNRSTVLVDISAGKDPEALLAQLSSKVRNQVRKAGRNGVEVEQHADEAGYERMWALWEQVVADQGLTVRGHDYQTMFWRTFCESGHGRIFIATHEGTDVCAAFVTVYGSMACYKDGASLRQRPVAGASQRLQYEAMCWAASQGATTYDMCGTPHSTKVDDPTDPFHGLGEFKRGFNKHVTDYVGAWDLPLRPLRYQAWEKVGHRVLGRLLAKEPGDRFY